MKKNLAEGRKPIGRKTIFYDVLTNDQVRPQEKTTQHLVTEAQSIVAAGMFTTAHILQIIAFYVLENPDILMSLQEELAGVFKSSDTKPSWRQLEKLPYLTAVINEGLRMGHGVMHRLQRISPDTALQFNQWTIPKGASPTLIPHLISRRADVS